MISTTRPILSLFALCVVAPLLAVDAFVSPNHQAVASFQAQATATTLFAKKPDFDLSSIESRDMTPEEMLELNKKNEEIMYVRVDSIIRFEPS